MYKKINININTLCDEYLNEGATLRSLAEKYDCDNKTIHYKLKKSKNEMVLFKMKNNKSTKYSCIDIEDNKVIIIANNTKNKFYLPLYLYETVKNHGWSETNKGYLRANINGDIIFAHHLVTGHPISKEYHIDHKDNNSKNNLPENLRLVTRIINNHNRKTKAGKYKGSSKVKENKWKANIVINKKSFYLGTYKTEKEASLKYFEVKSNLYGFEYMSPSEIEQYNELLTYFRVNEGVINEI